MKVYLVTRFENYEPDVVCGVFRSFEGAADFIDTLPGSNYDYGIQGIRLTEA